MENLEMSLQFWKGRKVLITGHTGFKGSWLTLWLHSLGADITGFALPPSTKPSLYEIARVEHGIRSVFGDIRDYSHFLRVLQASKAEIVFHLAAQSLVRYSYGDPIGTYSTNVMGTVHVLEAIRHSSSVRSCIVVTSDKCYENREWIWGYRENEAMGGYDPYSNSKGCAELVVSAFRSSFFGFDTEADKRVALASVRAGNVIGGGDWASDRLVPDLMRGFANGIPAVIRKPSAIRPWQHVLDPLRGYIDLAWHLMEHGAEFAEAWNFGPYDHDAKSVQWIAGRLSELWGVGAGFRIDQDTETLHEANYLRLDSSKARSRIGWMPRWSLETALEEIVLWYQECRRDQDMRDVTLDQINRYENDGA